MLHWSLTSLSAAASGCLQATGLERRRQQVLTKAAARRFASAIRSSIVLVAFVGGPPEPACRNLYLPAGHSVHHRMLALDLKRDGARTSAERVYVRVVYIMFSLVLHALDWKHVLDGVRRTGAWRWWLGTCPTKHRAVGMPGSHW
jgi:hypothetical protein